MESGKTSAADSRLYGGQTPHRPIAPAPAPRQPSTPATNAPCCGSSSTGLNVELDTPAPHEPPPHAADTVSPPVHRSSPPLIHRESPSSSRMPATRHSPTEVERATQQAEHAAPDRDPRRAPRRRCHESMPSRAFDAGGPAEPTQRYTFSGRHCPRRGHSARAGARNGRATLLRWCGRRVALASRSWPWRSAGRHAGRGRADSAVVQALLSPVHRRCVALRRDPRVASLVPWPPSGAQLVAALTDLAVTSIVPPMSTAADHRFRMSRTGEAGPRQIDDRRHVQACARSSVSHAGHAPSSSPATPAEIATLQPSPASAALLPFGDARFSPDERLVAFVDERGDGARGVYVANGDGTDVRRVGGTQRAPRRAGRPIPGSWHS